MTKDLCLPKTCRIWLFLALLCCGRTACAQLASSVIGPPLNYIVNVSFGEGDSSHFTGPPVPGITSFRYTSDPCPPPGYYALIQRSSVPGCYHHGLNEEIYTDHTLYSNDGFMMLVNDTTTPYNKIVYMDTIRHASCAGNQYEFSAAILNAASPGYCDLERKPAFIFSVETTAGQVIRSMGTPRISQGGSFSLAAYGSSVYGFDFTLPPGTNEYVIKIIDSANGNGGCGYYFLMDDIKLISLGAATTVRMDGLPSDHLQTSVCFQHPVTISMTGEPVSGYANPALQWEQSTDGGLTWYDLPGANGYHYTTQPLAQPDTILYRLRTNEAADIANPFCGGVSNTVKVEIDGLPQTHVFTSNSPLCTDSNLVFTLSGGASYITTGPQGFFDDSPFPHISFPKVSNSGTYYTQIISQGGCTVTDSTVVKIIGPNVIVSADASICYGQAVRLHASGGQNYLWTPASGLSNEHSPDPLASPVTATKYTVRVADESGCTASASVVVSLRDSILEARMTAPDFVCPGDAAHLADTSLGVVTAWHWDLGNGATSSLRFPPDQRYPVATGSMDVPLRLIVTDTAGCTDTAYHTIRAASNCFINVPSAFTPNGDGLNDYLYPLDAYKATRLTFRVYDRNGGLVFETSDWTRKWDGRRNGIPQPSGAYAWTLAYTDPDRGAVFLKGTSVLIR